MSELIYSIRDIFGSEVSTACLPQSDSTAFWIPAYQRGYKWGADGEKESTQPVDQLLSDLKRAWKNRASEYLLQAITVKKVKDEIGGSVLEVIDGQQRLTTLFILLHVLGRRLRSETGSNIAAGKLHYSIRHKDPTLDELAAGWLNLDTPSTGTFAEWKAFQEVGQEKHQDHAYLHCAALRCLFEFRYDTDNENFKDDGSVAAFQSYLLDHVKLLVNRVEPHVEGEMIFAALNSNRVPLTECELIKGVLLTRVARRPLVGRSRRYREILELRIQLGRKWDEIQHWANRKEIRSFYFSIEEVEAGSDGMMRMLELAALQSPKNAYHSKTGRTNAERRLFTHLFEFQDPGLIFDLLIATFTRLRDWYEKDDTYHLMGYCLTGNREGRTSLLVKLLSYDTKTKVWEELLKRRRNMLLEQSKEWQIDQLRYPDHSDQLQNIFLALSVFSRGKDSRFNFYAYAKQHWSLEHIFPQTPFGKGASLSEEDKAAALDLIESSEELLGKDATEKISQFRKSPNLTELKEKVEDFLKSVPILHQAGNLCLLSREDNAAMGCGMFNDKRRVIRQRIAKGSFVPRHTYEVFSKMIVQNDKDFTVWSRSDVDRHTSTIKQRIDELIKESA